MWLHDSNIHKRVQFLRATAYMLYCVYATPIPSVRLSHACFVSKRLNASSKFFHCPIGPSFYFFVIKGRCSNLMASSPTGAPNTRGSNFRPFCLCGYISETVIDKDRGIVAMKDEYKVVCAPSNSAMFDDHEWPRTPVSRSRCSLKANISQTVHPINSMFGSRLRFSGSADRMALFAVR